MADPIYPRTDGAFVDGARFTVLGEPPGPAGISSVTFPNGDIWQVDHADPSRLVSLETDPANPTTSRLLAAAVGGDELLFLIDTAGSPDDIEWDELDEDVPQSGPRTKPRGDLARRAGECVVLADLADDRRLHPLVRIAATVELAVSLPASPVEALLAPVSAALLTRARDLADQVDDDELELIDAEDAAVLQALLQQLEPTNRFDATWSQLADRLRWDQRLLQHAVEALRTEVIQAVAAPPPTIDQLHEVRRLDDAVMEVVVARAGRERWVRAFQRDGLILVGQAPLRLDDLIDRAEVVVPADLDDDELAFEIVDAPDMKPPPERPIDRVRAAITAGREAAQASRADVPYRAGPRWTQCADLWELAGDRRRAELARRLAASGGVPTGFRPVADRLAEVLPGTG